MRKRYSYIRGTCTCNLLHRYNRTFMIILFVYYFINFKLCKKTKQWRVMYDIILSTDQQFVMTAKLLNTL